MATNRYNFATTEGFQPFGGHFPSDYEGVEMSAPILDQKTICELLDYNPETGEFRWKLRDRKWFPTQLACKTWNTRYAGTAAGSRAVIGYWRVSILNHRYWAHRLAWVFVYGEWPKQNIDHIDGNPLNNRICNLRDVSQRTNLQNKKRAQKNNRTTGVLGVSLYRATGKYQTGYYLDGKRTHIGFFDTVEEARLAREAVVAKRYEGYVP